MHAPSFSITISLGIGCLFWSGCSQPPSQPDGSAVRADEGGRPANVSFGETFERTANSDSALDEPASGDDGVATARRGGIASKVGPPVIGQLRSRNHTIVIHAGSDGPRFTVMTPGGEVIVSALSADEMRTKHPEIYKTYQKTFAQQDGYIDASNTFHIDASR